MARKCFRVVIGTGLGLISNCMPREQAARIKNLIDKGGLHTWVVETKGKISRSGKVQVLPKKKVVRRKNGRLNLEDRLESLNKDIQWAENRLKRILSIHTSRPTITSAMNITEAEFSYAYASCLRHEFRKLRKKKLRISKQEEADVQRKCKYEAGGKWMVKTRKKLGYGERHFRGEILYT